MVYSLMGPSRLGGFLVYSFIGFWGLFLFHRAALHRAARRAANVATPLLVFFLPSLVFWPSSIGKEAVMMLSLGVCAYGAARILERAAAGAGSRSPPESDSGYMVRPHVAVVVLAALAVAILFRRRRGQPAGSRTGRPARHRRAARWRRWRSCSARPSIACCRSRRRRAAIEASESCSTGRRAGTDEGGSEIDRPSPNNPLDYPNAAFSVLFRPTILEARPGWRRRRRGGDDVRAGALRRVVEAAAQRAGDRLPPPVRAVLHRVHRHLHVRLVVVRQPRRAGPPALQVWPFVLLLLAVPRSLAERQRRRDASARGRHLPVAWPPP